jgi:hypothetical protein
MQLHALKQGKQRKEDNSNREENGRRIALWIEKDCIVPIQKA